MRNSLNTRQEVGVQFQKHLRKIQQIKNHASNNNKGTDQYEKFVEYQLLKTADQPTVYQKNLFCDKFSESKRKSEKRLAIRLPSKNYSKQRLENIKPSKSISRIDKKTLSVKQFLLENDKHKLEQAIKMQHLNRRQYRKRIKSEVSEYVKLREHMQKFKTNNMNIIFSRKNGPKTERKSPEQYKKFLTEAIESTRQKINPKQFQTEKNYNF